MKLTRSRWIKLEGNRGNWWVASVETCFFRESKQDVARQKGQQPTEWVKMMETNAGTGQSKIQ